MPSTPPPPPAAVDSKIDKGKRTEQTQGRGPVFVFIEILCTLLVVSDVNQKLCDGRNKRDRFPHFNDSYEYYIKVMYDSKKWVDQLGDDETSLAHPLPPPKIVKNKVDKTPPHRPCRKHVSPPRPKKLRQNYYSYFHAIISLQK